MVELRGNDQQQRVKDDDGIISWHGLSFHLSDKSICLLSKRSRPRRGKEYELIYRIDRTSIGLYKYMSISASESIPFPPLKRLSKRFEQRKQLNDFELKNVLRSCDLRQ